MKVWIAGALALCAGALVVRAYHTTDPGSMRKADPWAPTAVAEPTGPPAPRVSTPSEAAELPPNVGETSPLPASLQTALDHDPRSRIAQFHEQMAREGRDPAWALQTEYQLQVALHEAAPGLLGRAQLVTTCASSICEMVGVINGPDRAQARRDTKEWELVLHRVPASDGWMAMDLGGPIGWLFTPSSEGGQSFIAEFPRKRLASR